MNAPAHSTALPAVAGTGSGSPLLALALAALGVVYGDIGTSPLYALRAALTQTPGVEPVRDDILGVLSLVTWALILVVTVKYVVVLLRADNRGEGGILALMALAQRALPEGRLRRWAALVGIFGASLFFGECTITPAISVLSAIEGLAVVDETFEQAVVPLSLVVLAALFAVQRRGTGQVGAVFGPITLVWFATIAALGAAEIAVRPDILVALSPHHAVRFAIEHGFAAFAVLGAVVLVVTGAEALFADMGHFGRRPIRLAWLGVVLPALLLNYFGQGALLLGDGEAIANPFYLLAPDWLRLPLVFLATAATIIASQAVISGAFSIARQTMLLGFSPRLTVRHTSSDERGQIYMPQVNAALFVAVVLLVLAFRSSDSLAAAYGLAVTGTFVCGTALGAAVALRLWGWSPALAGPIFGLFLLVDLAFLASTLLKIPDGAWFPLLLGLALFALMTSWKRGRDLMFERWRSDSLPLASFLARLPESRNIIRVPGIAAFMTGNPDYVPNALLHNLKHNRVLHERVLFITVVTEDVPTVPAERRAEVKELAPGIVRIVLHYGFMEQPNIPRALAELRPFGEEIDPMQVSFFLGRETVVPAQVPKMPLWRHWLFLVMARNAVPATEFFRIPSDRVVELGVRVAI
ncbi:MAG: potassium transporter Kup [Acetobacteraceae bacterium]|nr:potassium transporter Kup [Acetobacteraceae bacterium]